MNYSISIILQIQNLQNKLEMNQRDDRQKISSLFKDASYIEDISFIEKAKYSQRQSQVNDFQALLGDEQKQELALKGKQLDELNRYCQDQYFKAMHLRNKKDEYCRKESVKIFQNLFNNKIMQFETNQSNYTLKQSIILNYWKLLEELQSNQQKILKILEFAYYFLRKCLTKFYIKKNNMSLILVLLAKQKCSIGKYEAALEHCDQALSYLHNGFKANTQLLKIHYMRARIYKKTQQYNQELEQIRKCENLIKVINKQNQTTKQLLENLSMRRQQIIKLKNLTETKINQIMPRKSTVLSLHQFRNLNSFKMNKQKQSLNENDFFRNQNQEKNRYSNYKNDLQTRTWSNQGKSSFFSKPNRALSLNRIKPFSNQLDEPKSKRQFKNKSRIKRKSSKDDLMAFQILAEYQQSNTMNFYKKKQPVKTNPLKKKLKRTPYMTRANFIQTRAKDNQKSLNKELSQPAKQQIMNQLEKVMREFDHQSQVKSRQISSPIDCQFYKILKSQHKQPELKKKKMPTNYHTMFNSYNQLILDRPSVHRSLGANTNNKPKDGYQKIDEQIKEDQKNEFVPEYKIGQQEKEEALLKKSVNNVQQDMLRRFLDRMFYNFRQAGNSTQESDYNDNILEQQQHQDTSSSHELSEQNQHNKDFKQNHSSLCYFMQLQIPQFFINMALGYGKINCQIRSKKVNNIQQVFKNKQQYVIFDCPEKNHIQDSSNSVIKPIQQQPQQNNIRQSQQECIRKNRNSELFKLSEHALDIQSQKCLPTIQNDQQNFHEAYGQIYSNICSKINTQQANIHTLIEVQIYCKIKTSNQLIFNSYNNFTLKLIVNIDTKGIFETFSTSQEGLQVIFKRISQLQKTELNTPIMVLVQKTFKYLKSKAKHQIQSLNIEPWGRDNESEKKIGRFSDDLFLTRMLRSKKSQADSLHDTTFRDSIINLLTKNLRVTFQKKVNSSFFTLVSRSSCDQNYLSMLKLKQAIALYPYRQYNYQQQKQTISYLQQQSKIINGQTFAREPINYEIIIKTLDLVLQKNQQLMNYKYQVTPLTMNINNTFYRKKAILLKIKEFDSIIKRQVSNARHLSSFLDVINLTFNTQNITTNERKSKTISDIYSLIEKKSVQQQNFGTQIYQKKFTRLSINSVGNEQQSMIDKVANAVIHYLMKAGAQTKPLAKPQSNNIKQDMKIPKRGERSNMKKKTKFLDSHEISTKTIEISQTDLYFYRVVKIFLTSSVSESAIQISSSMGITSSILSQPIISNNIQQLTKTQINNNKNYPIKYDKNDEQSLKKLPSIYSQQKENKKNLKQLCSKSSNKIVKNLFLMHRFFDIIEVNHLCRIGQSTKLYFVKLVCYQIKSIYTNKKDRFYKIEICEKDLRAKMGKIIMSQHDFMQFTTSSVDQKFKQITRQILSEKLIKLSKKIILQKDSIYYRFGLIGTDKLFFLANCYSYEQIQSNFSIILPKKDLSRKARSKNKKRTMFINIQQNLNDSQDDISEMNSSLDYVDSDNQGNNLRCSSKANYCHKSSFSRKVIAPSLVSFQTKSRVRTILINNPVQLATKVGINNPNSFLSKKIKTRVTLACKILNLKITKQKYTVDESSSQTSQSPIKIYAILMVTRISQSNLSNFVFYLPSITKNFSFHIIQTKFIENYLTEFDINNVFGSLIDHHQLTKQQLSSLLFNGYIEDQNKQKIIVLNERQKKILWDNFINLLTISEYQTKNKEKFLIATIGKYTCYLTNTIVSQYITINNNRMALLQMSLLPKKRSLAIKVPKNDKNMFSQEKIQKKRQKLKNHKHQKQQVSINQSFNLQQSDESRLISEKNDEPNPINYKMRRKKNNKTGVFMRKQLYKMDRYSEKSFKISQQKAAKLYQQKKHQDKQIFNKVIEKKSNQSLFSRQTFISQSQCCDYMLYISLIETNTLNKQNWCYYLSQLINIDTKNIVKEPTIRAESRSFINNGVIKIDNESKNNLEDEDYRIKLSQGQANESMNQQSSFQHSKSRIAKQNIPSSYSRKQHKSQFQKNEPSFLMKPFQPLVLGRTQKKYVNQLNERVYRYSQLKSKILLLKNKINEFLKTDKSIFINEDQLSIRMSNSNKKTLLSIPGSAVSFKKSKNKNGLANVVRRPEIVYFKPVHFQSANSLMRSSLNFKKEHGKSENIIDTRLVLLNRLLIHDNTLSCMIYDSLSVSLRAYVINLAKCSYKEKIISMGFDKFFVCPFLLGFDAQDLTIINRRFYKYYRNVLLLQMQSLN